jgi:hypothetical protein
MLEDYSFDFSLVLTSHSIAKCLVHIEAFPVEPVFTFFLGFSTINMNRFVRLIGIEKDGASHELEVLSARIISPLGVYLMTMFTIMPILDFRLIGHLITLSARASTFGGTVRPISWPP